MGCCVSTEADGFSAGGGQTLGGGGGSAMSQEEHRRRAAAAAEARAQSLGTRGQQGAKSKMRPVVPERPELPGSNPLADPRSWD